MAPITDEVSSTLLLLWLLLTCIEGGGIAGHTSDVLLLLVLLEVSLTFDADADADAVVLLSLLLFVCSTLIV